MADLERLGFTGVLDPRLLGSQLTAVQRQLVEIMRAMAGETAPRIIAFDEPASSLSEHEVEALFALIRRLRSQGIAIVYVCAMVRWSVCRTHAPRTTVSWCV
ncbi:hypothetical protein [Streptomyces sp. NPDC057301]|uniref:hypothetical protein n=1 Tax=Streptomyces sp. NPDC057301 TaxID=3346093 RepID=UPI0036368599